MILQGTWLILSTSKYWDWGKIKSLDVSPWMCITSDHFIVHPPSKVLGEVLKPWEQKTCSSKASDTKTQWMGALSTFKDSVYSLLGRNGKDRWISGHCPVLRWNLEDRIHTIIYIYMFKRLIIQYTQYISIISIYIYINLYPDWRMAIRFPWHGIDDHTTCMDVARRRSHFTQGSMACFQLGTRAEEQCLLSFSTQAGTCFESCVELRVWLIFGQSV